MKQQNSKNTIDETWQILHYCTVKRTVVLKQLPSGVNDIQLYQDFVSTLIESSWFVKIWQSLYKGLSLRHICSHFGAFFSVFLFRRGPSVIGCFSLLGVVP